MRVDLKRRLSKLEGQKKRRNPNRVFCYSTDDSEADIERKCRAQGLEGPYLFAPDYGSVEAWEVAAARQQSALVSQLQHMHVATPVEKVVDPSVFHEVPAPRPIKKRKPFPDEVQFRKDETGGSNEIVFAIY